LETALKQGEIDYLKKAGDTEAREAFDKPFSKDTCSKNLLDLGLIMALLPQPPARLLDLGCGTGWTSAFFARRGYRVTGQDIAPDMIALAERNRARYEAENLDFVLSDYESLNFDDPFDCAVFYDSLHHAVDERAALASVYRALRPGGVLITHEPGAGHSQSGEAKRAMALYGVTEKDMPPAHIRDVCKSIGFSSFEFLPDPALTMMMTHKINIVSLTRVHLSLYYRMRHLLKWFTDRDLQDGGICIVTK